MRCGRARGDGERRCRLRIGPLGSCAAGHHSWPVLITCYVVIVTVTTLMGPDLYRHYVRRWDAAVVMQVVLAKGHGWTARGLDGPIASSCHYGHAAGGELLPDPRCTPGAVDGAVSERTRPTTICRAGGYTASVRPPQQLTQPVKRAVMAAYGVPWSQASHYELDHLIELNAGGASDVRNLWPEPNTMRRFRPSAFVHNDKDAVESYTYHALCAGRVSVPAVQAAVAADWTIAVRALHLPSIPPDYRG
jgi:hypothetical protein